MDFIVYRTRKEVDKFRDFLERRFIKGRLRVSADTLEFYNLFLKDIYFIDKLLGVRDDDKKFEKFNDPEWTKKLNEMRGKILEDLKTGKKEEINKIIIDKLVMWFKFYQKLA